MFIVANVEYFYKVSFLTIAALSNFRITSIRSWLVTSLAIFLLLSLMGHRRILTPLDYIDVLTIVVIAVDKLTPITLHLWFIHLVKSTWI